MSAALVEERGTTPAGRADEARWAAVVRRDRRADGQFVYAVRTTGIFCRPGCAARQPRREHVRFFPTRDSAVQAGFRPCRRCRPEGPAPAAERAAAVARACRLIEGAEEAPSLATLARAAGLSRFHFHRLFTATTGVTPRAYGAACRARRMRDELPRTATVTEAVYRAGFGSNGRFYAEAPQILGMTPTRYRAGGPGAAIRFAVGACSLGSILVAATDRGVCAILLGDAPERLVRELRDRFPMASLVGGDRRFARIVARVVDLVEAPAVGLDLPLDVRGTAFQRRVWQALRGIPAGATVSYAEVARRIGAPGAARAVAGACAANPLAVAIPCHRVVRADGAMAGYRWGARRKRLLLEREAAS